MLLYFIIILLFIVIRSWLMAETYNIRIYIIILLAFLFYFSQIF